MSWANLVKPKANTTSATPTANPVEAMKKPSAPRAFAFASANTGSSWANIVTPGGPKFGFSNKLNKSRAQDLKSIDFDLESSRAGLNLAFKSVVNTSSTSSSSSIAMTPANSSNVRQDTPTTAKVSEAHVTSKTHTNNKLSSDKQKSADPTPAQIAKREKQIGFGKNTIGYKNYCHKVPKNERVANNPRHPTTPNPKIGSKRKFTGLVKKWRRSIHLWDDEGPFKSEIVSGTTTSTTTASTVSAIKEQLLQQKPKERVLRSKSWADMADSDDSDSDSDEEMVTDAKEISTLKRKAEDELISARMEKKANTTTTTHTNKTESKPKSRALQLPKERAAARKAADSK
jgi:hypothetical protein